MLFYLIGSKIISMGKCACKKKDFVNKEEATFICTKCDAKVKKKDKVCNPKKIIN